MDRRSKEAQRKRAYEARRSRALSTSDPKWRRIRAGVLAREPLCRYCAERGRTVAATQVDHADGNSGNNSPDNLVPSCATCNYRKAATEGFNRGKTVREGCDADGNPRGGWKA